MSKLLREMKTPKEIGAAAFHSCQACVPYFDDALQEYLRTQNLSADEMLTAMKEWITGWTTERLK